MKTFEEIYANHNEFLENQGGYNKVADRSFISMVSGYKNLTQRPPMSRDTALAYLKTSDPVTYNFLLSLKEKDNKFD